MGAAGGAPAERNGARSTLAPREATEAGAVTGTKRAAALRVATYNIHKAIGGVDRKYRPERVIEVLRACRADLVLLQEVDDGAPRSRHHRQVDLLGDALELPYRAFFANVTLKRGSYGNALLSRLPLDHRENIDLTRRFKKARGALHARLTVEAGARRQRVWVYNVHLGLAQAERRRQLRDLLVWHRAQRVQGDVAVLLGGDLNDVWARLGRTILEPAGFRAAAAGQATFPAVRPLRPLDALFVRGPVRVTRCRACDNPLAREASDHLPLVTSLRVG